MNEPILLVEDEEHNVIFMELALQQAKVNNRLAVAKDGREAIAYLKGEGKFGNRPEYPLPGLVLLDLRLPQIPGLEVLEWIRGQTALKDVPVIVLSSSNQDQDVATAYRLGARAYVIKPAYPQLVEFVRRLKRYWIEMDAPPPNCNDWLSFTVPSPTQNPRR